MDATKHYSTREAARVLDVTEDQIRAYARLGEIVPDPGPGGRLEFRFQHLLLLKTTKGLLEAGVPPRRLRRVWSSLRRQLATDLPLTSITIYADGDRAVASDGNARWQPESGQCLLDFEGSANPVMPGLKLIEATEEPEGPEEPELTAEQWFHLGTELESQAPADARNAYRRALDLDPDSSDAHLNLGRLEHESGELGKAEAHYRDAVRCAPDDPTGHFNLGVLLEDRGRFDEAVHAYEQAIARDPESADAHYNLGLLLETRGRRSEAIRHLMAARNLYEHSSGS